MSHLCTNFWFHSSRSFFNPAGCLALFACCRLSLIASSHWLAGWLAGLPHPPSTHSLTRHTLSHHIPSTPDPSHITATVVTVIVNHTHLAPHATVQRWLVSFPSHPIPSHHLAQPSRSLIASHVVSLLVPAAFSFVVQVRVCCLATLITRLVSPAAGCDSDAPLFPGAFLSSPLHCRSIAPPTAYRRLLCSINRLVIELSMGR